MKERKGQKKSFLSAFALLRSSKKPHNQLLQLSDKLPWELSLYWNADIFFTQNNLQQQIVANKFYYLLALWQFSSKYEHIFSMFYHFILQLYVHEHI